MNSMLQRLMTDATRLTQEGQLQAATEAIQRALRSGMPMAPASSDPSATFEAFARRAAAVTAAAAAAAGAASAASAAGTETPAHPNASVVLEGVTRVIAKTTETTGTEAKTPAAVMPAVDTAPGRTSLDAGAERWTDGSFTHQGRTLAYKLYVPPRNEGAPPAPRALVLMLHGCTQNPADFATGTRMNELARKAGVVVLYPAQTQHANSQKCWNWFKPQHQQRGRGEPALLAALTQSVIAAENIDPARVYVAGLSAGGAMADIMGRVYPDVFAAVGVHSGLPAGAATDLPSAMAAMRGGAGSSASGPKSPASSATRKVPTIVFHGDADATVHPGNASAIVRAALDDGIGNAAGTRVVEGSSAQGQRFTHTVYPGADGHAALELWLLRGAGHAWSGGSSSGTYTDPRGADASAEMLRFFLAHPMSRG